MSRSDRFPNLSPDCCPDWLSLRGIVKLPHQNNRCHRVSVEHAEALSEIRGLRAVAEIGDCEIGIRYSLSGPEYTEPRGSHCYKFNVYVCGSLGFRYAQEFHR